MDMAGKVSASIRMHHVSVMPSLVQEVDEEVKREGIISRQ